MTTKKQINPDFIPACVCDFAWVLSLEFDSRRSCDISSPELNHPQVRWFSKLIRLYLALNDELSRSERDIDPLDQEAWQEVALEFGIDELSISELLLACMSQAAELHGHFRPELTSEQYLMQKLTDIQVYDSLRKQKKWTD